MIQTTKYSFKENNVVIEFYSIAIIDGEKTQKYLFRVVDDPELTEKLRASVKKQKVTENEFFYCAKALFKRIRNENFEKTPSSSVGAELSELCQLFQKKYKVSPIFSERRISPGVFTVALENDFLEVSYEGAGFNKAQAKINALKNCLG
ncbi:MAG: hypothetical protein MUD00_02340 [Candidatus Pacebacteria bacterium]|jgi:hypothetical protein|nr:hypothetical protein [Candidatus Paceibacterota bacterium]